MPIDLETLDAALAALADFVRRNLPDARLREFDRNDEFPEALVRRMCSEELGIQLFSVPEKYGGLGAGSFGVYRICEQLARTDVRIATGVLATFLGSEPISVGGTETQKQQWLGRIAAQGILMADRRRDACRTAVAAVTGGRGSAAVSPTAAATTRSPVPSRASRRSLFGFLHRFGFRPSERLPFSQALQAA